MSAVGAVRSGVWVELDVTATIPGEGVYSFALRSRNSKLVVFNSNAAAENQPVLVIASTRPSAHGPAARQGRLEMQIQQVKSDSSCRLGLGGQHIWRSPARQIFEHVSLHPWKRGAPAKAAMPSAPPTCARPAEANRCNSAEMADDGLRDPKLRQAHRYIHQTCSPAPDHYDEDPHQPPNQ